MEITKQEGYALQLAQMYIYEHNWEDFNSYKLTKLLWRAFKLGREYERENYQIKEDNQNDQ